MDMFSILDLEEDPGGQNASPVPKRAAEVEAASGSEEFSDKAEALDKKKAKKKKAKKKKKKKRRRRRKESDPMRAKASKGVPRRRKESDPRRRMKRKRRRRRAYKVRKMHVLILRWMPMKVKQ